MVDLDLPREVFLQEMSLVCQSRHGLGCALRCFSMRFEQMKKSSGAAHLLQMS